MIRLKSANAYKVFSPIKFSLSELAFQRHDALSSNGAVLISQPTANFSDVKFQPLQSLLNSVRLRRRVRILTDIWHTRSPYQSRSLSIKGSLINQPRLRRHGAKTPRKSVFTLFQINFYHSYSTEWKRVEVDCQLLVNGFLVFNSKVTYLNVGKRKTIVFQSESVPCLVMFITRTAVFYQCLV